jgi:hypothetical protein
MVWDQSLQITKNVEIYHNILDTTLRVIRNPFHHKRITFIHHPTTPESQQQSSLEDDYPLIPETDYYMPIRHVCRRSRQRAGPVVILECRHCDDFSHDHSTSAYNLDGCLISHISRFMINSSIDIINFRDFQSLPCQYLVKGRPSVTVALDWRLGSSYKESNFWMMVQLAKMFAPRKIYLGFSRFDAFGKRIRKKIIIQRAVLDWTVAIEFLEFKQDGLPLFEVCSSIDVQRNRIGT